MTTTGTGLVVNVNRTPSGSYLGFDHSQPTGCPNSLANCNYQIVNGAFSGNVVNGSLTYQITNLAVSNGNTLTGPGVGTLSLTYTDPHSGAVTVSITGTSASVPASGTATLGTTGIAIVMGTGGIGNIYSGYTGSTSTATLIGTISGGMVYFIDGTTQSL